MKKLAFVAVGVLTAALALTGCAPDKSGSPAVYDSIDAESKCSVLQVMFDQFRSDGFDKISNGAPDGKYYSTYMKYTTNRMEDLNCYG